MAGKAVLTPHSQRSCSLLSMAVKGLSCSQPASAGAGHSLAPAQPVQPPEPLQQGQDSYAAAAAAAAAGSAAKAAAAGDSLAAMEAFAQVARKQEEV